MKKIPEVATLTKLFTQIVAIDSPSGQEYQMAEFLKSWLKKQGFNYKSDKLGSILACPKNQATPQLLICAHMDTVEPGCNILPIIKDDIISSSGNTILGADNKAGVAAILFSIEKYSSVHHSLPPVELLFTVREESGGGVEFFPFDWIQSKKGVLFDYANPLGKIITSSPYIYNFKVKFIGSSSHASRPEEGNNSLIPAAKFITHVSQGKFDNGLTTINIGLVNSGTGINVIPGTTLIQGEVRSCQKKLFDQHLSFIKDTATKIATANHLKLEFDLDGYCAGYNYSSADSFLCQLTDILKQLELTPEFHQSTSVSDANPLVGAGIKMVCLSDGVQNPHSTTEKISINDLSKLSQLVGAILDFSNGI